jgi:anti-sigma factor RsiW
MTCRGTKKYLPLLAGDELSQKKALKVKAHLERCPGCRKEAEEISAALDAAKGMAQKEALRDWTDAEWRQMLRSVTAAKVVRRQRAVRLVQKPAFAFGLALMIFAAGALWLHKKLPWRPEEGDALQARSQTAAQRSGESSGQDVMSMTIVSQETGLKIVWFFNKNFEWKENRQ